MGLKLTGWVENLFNLNQREEWLPVFLSWKNKHKKYPIFLKRLLQIEYTYL